MAVYYCHQHGGYVDDDWHPMDEDGVCPDCVEQNEVDHVPPKNITFTASQLDIIKKAEADDE